MSTYDGHVMLTPAPLAAADLSAKTYRYVKITANGPDSANIAGGATGAIGCGVLLNAPKSGDICDIGTVGNSSLPYKYAGTLALNEEVKANADGEGVLADTAGDIVIGICIKAGVAGDVGRIMPVLYRKHA